MKAAPALLSIALAAAGVSAQPADPGVEFVQRLKRIADDGLLFDPAAMSRELGTGLQAQGPIPASLLEPCAAGPLFSEREVARFAAPGDWWFKPAAGAAGPLVFSYRITRDVNCRLTRNLQDRRYAEIAFRGLPSHVCITVAQLRERLPGSRYLPATDGFSVVGYQGRVDDDSGAFLNFEFRYGSECALEASIRQDVESGWRFRRARLRHIACTQATAQRVCSDVRSMALTEIGMTRRVAAEVAGACGPLQAMFAAEPASKEAPPDGAHATYTSGSCPQQ